MADRVTVIGWDGSPLTRAATAALSGATLVAGAAHHLALPEVPPTAERVRLGSVDLAARRIAGHRGSAVVLADGDPGFFGVVRTLRAREHGLEVEVVPAVSSVATAFARAGMPWDDAQIVVAHPRTLRRAVKRGRPPPNRSRLPPNRSRLPPNRGRLPSSRGRPSRSRWPPSRPRPRRPPSSRPRRRRPSRSRPSRRAGPWPGPRRWNSPWWPTRRRLRPRLRRPSRPSSRPGRRRRT
ncbi:hypothetical protein SCALM49S_09931 [Streptomyces californicus]